MPDAARRPRAARSPIPSPGRSCAPDRRNSSNTRTWSRGSMPRPSSATRNRARPSSTSAVTDTRPGTPGRRYFTALSTRLEKTCSAAIRSITRVRHRPDRQRRAGRQRPMRHAVDDRAHQPPHVDGLGLEHPRALARQHQDRLDEAIHLVDRGLDEADRLVEVLPQRGVGGRLGEDVGAEPLQLGGEAHDVDERGPQIMADDIGEALHFGVAFLQIRGAFGDALLQAAVGGGEGAPRARHVEVGPRLHPALPPRQGQDDEERHDGAGREQQERPQPGQPAGLDRRLAVADRQVDRQVADALVEAEPAGGRDVAAGRRRLRRRRVQRRERRLRDGRNLGHADQHMPAVGPHQRHVGVVRKLQAPPVADEIVEVRRRRHQAAEPTVGLGEAPRDEEGGLAGDPSDERLADHQSCRPVARRREGRPIRQGGVRGREGQGGAAQLAGGVGEQQVADVGQGIRRRPQLVVERARRLRVVPGPLAERQGGGAQREVGDLEQPGRVVGHRERGTPGGIPGLPEGDLALVPGDEGGRAEDEGEPAGAQGQRDAADGIARPAGQGARPGALRHRAAGDGVGGHRVRRGSRSGSGPSHTSFRGGAKPGPPSRVDRRCAHIVLTVSWPRLRSSRRSGTLFG